MVRQECEKAGIGWAIWEDPINMSLFDALAGTWLTGIVGIDCFVYDIAALKRGGLVGFVGGVALLGCGQYGLMGPPKLRQDLYPNLRTSYDEFKDQTTTVSFTHIGPFLMLQLFAVSKGHSPSPAEYVGIGIEHDSRDWQHNRDPSLILLIDGRRTGLDPIT